MKYPRTDDSHFNIILDRIIPPIDDLPGAGGLGLLDEINRMSTDHTKFEGVTSYVFALIIGGLNHNLDDPTEIDKAIQHLETSNPKQFELFLEIIYLAYYSNPRVHERIGWKTGALQPDGFPLPPWNPSVLDKVKSRQPFWTQVD